jgi:hypothetical protein
MGKRYSLDEEKPVRRRCPECCFYIRINGQWQKEANEDGHPRFSGMPGMRFYHDPDSKDMYERIGFNTPCTCAAGAQVREGYKNEEEKELQKEVA